MGNINCSKQFMRDTISEEIALKSGLLLTTSEAYTVLKRRGFPDVELF